VAEKQKKDGDKTADELFEEDFAEISREMTEDDKSVTVKPGPEIEEVEATSTVEEQPSEDLAEAAEPADLTEAAEPAVEAADEFAAEDAEKAAKKVEKKAAKKSRRDEQHEEHIFIIPMKFPVKMAAYRRAGRSIRDIRKYLARHTKTSPKDIHIDASINQLVWARGGKHVPPRIRVRAMKFEDGVVEAEALME